MLCHKEQGKGSGLVKVLVKGPCFSSARSQSAVSEAGGGWSVSIAVSVMTRSCSPVSFRPALL